MDERFPDHGKAARIREILKRRVVISRATSGRRWILVSLRQGHSGGPHQVRKSDEPGEDRSDERVEIDWRGSAPRWALIALLTASVGLNGLFGAGLVGLVLDRWRMIEAAQRDPLWDIVGKLTAEQGVQSATLKQHEASLRDMADVRARMLDVQAELRVLNERLRRRGL